VLFPSAGERAFADRYQGDRLYGSYRPWTERVDHRRPSNRENGYHIDTIINQRDNYKNGNPLYCIYVAIGQKASSVAALVNTLKEHGALDYTVVLAANASDSAAMRINAPFAGAAIGEYFRDSGRHALVIY